MQILLAEGIMEEISQRDNIYSSESKWTEE